MSRKIWIALLALVVFFVMVAPAFAQDVPPDTAPVFTPPQPADVWQTVLTALFAIFASAIASPLTSPIVSLVKRIPVPFIQGLTGDQLNLGVAGVLSLIMWGAVAVGFGKEADTVYQLIYAVLPILVGAGSNFVGNQSVYKFGVKKSIPVLGYSRTPDPKVIIVGKVA